MPSKKDPDAFETFFERITSGDTPTDGNHVEKVNDKLHKIQNRYNGLKRQLESVQQEREQTLRDQRRTSGARRMYDALHGLLVPRGGYVVKPNPNYRPGYNKATIKPESFTQAWMCEIVDTDRDCMYAFHGDSPIDVLRQAESAEAALETRKSFYPISRIDWLARRKAKKTMGISEPAAVPVEPEPLPGESCTQGGSKLTKLERELGNLEKHKLVLMHNMGFRAYHAKVKIVKAKLEAENKPKPKAFAQGHEHPEHKGAVKVVKSCNTVACSKGVTKALPVSELTAVCMYEGCDKDAVPSKKPGGDTKWCRKHMPKKIVAEKCPVPSCKRKTIKGTAGCKSHPIGAL